jgi:hypothetical protein
MTGATALCEESFGTWGQRNLVVGERNEGDNADKAIENVPVTFEDPDDCEPTGQYARQVYRIIHAQPGLDGRSYVRAFQAETSQFGCGVEANTTVSSGSMLALAQVDVAPSAWRGVFALQHRHHELFSQRVQLDMGTLPRWKPQISINRRMLDDNDA